MAAKKVWNVRAEDVDMYKILEKGVFNSPEEAYNFILKELVEDISQDVDGYQEWLEEDEDKQADVEEYIEEQKKCLEEKMNSWLSEEEKESREFQWGIYVYTLNPTIYHL